MVLIFEEQNRKASKTNLKRADRRDASICFSMLYAANNGLLEKQTYGNGFTVGHAYDSLDRETSRSYNGTTKFWWTYNADGNLARYTESSGRVLEYLYDDIGRLLQVSGADGSYVKTSYDKLDKSTDLHYKTGSQPRDVYFNYSDKDNLPLNVKFGPSSKYIVENTYDDLTRLKTRTYAVPGTSSKLSASYGYIDWTSTEKRTTGTVRGIDYAYVSGGLTTYDRWYEYDGVGNITSENVWTSDDTKPVREKYTYDSKNQLIRHDSVTQNCTITYSYDAGGNITAKKTYAYTTGSLDNVAATNTINYTYGNSAWKDELTAYNGETISYDAIGNPTTYRGWTMAWYGRQLESASKNGTNLSFGYNADGIRLSKTVGSTTTQYLLNGTQILAQKTGSTILSFFYDQQGNRVGMADGSNNFYYYLYNIQGDVVALADASTGKLAATYTYDAWGKCTVTNASGYIIGTQNPFRYRGYYYDTETGLYYLNSRYYDPEVGRFINADVMLDTEDILGFNLFSYCGNNPIMYADPTGYGRTYVIYYDNPGSSFYRQAMNSPYYNKKSKDVYMIGVTSRQDFIDAWNSMSGTIDYVYLYLHGGKGVLYFKNESLGFSGRQNFSSLNSKKVRNGVYLFSCKGGAGNKGNNVAWMFAKLTSSKVYACTGSVSYSRIFGKYYARKAFDWGIIKTFYYQKRYIFWGAYVAKSAPGQW